MSQKCEINELEIITLVIKLLSDLFLFIVTGMAAYMFIKNKEFRHRASNIIVLSILISDSTVALLTHLYRSWLDTCDKVYFDQCSYVMIVTRIFSYISIAGLVFLSVERYIKVTTAPLHYEILFNTRRVYISMGALWLLCILFGLFTTPYWLYLLVFDRSSMTFPVCTYAEVLEPVVGIMTLCISQVISLIAIVIINIIFAYKVRAKILENEKVLSVTSEQHKINKNIIKQVEKNVFIISLVLCGLNIFLVFPLTVVDIVSFLNKLELTNVEQNTTWIQFLVFGVTLYPFFEALAVFFLNKDLKKFTRQTLRLGHKKTSKHEGSQPEESQSHQESRPSDEANQL